MIRWMENRVSPDPCGLTYVGHNLYVPPTFFTGEEDMRFRVERPLSEMCVDWLQTRQDRQSPVRQELRRIRRAGASELFLAMIVEEMGLGVDGERPWLEIIQAIIEWLSDPENQDKIFAIIKFIVSIVGMFA